MRRNSIDLTLRNVSIAASFICMLVACQVTDAQGLPGLGLDLTERTITGSVVGLDRNKGTVKIRTEDGLTDIEFVPANMRRMGLSTQVSVTGSEKPSWLTKRLMIYVTGEVDKSNKFVEPVKEIFLFTPDNQTVWGFEELPEEAEGDGRVVGLSAEISAVREDEIVVRYPVGRTKKRSVIPFAKDAKVVINSDEIRLARSGDAVSVTGYYVREPDLMMALNINVTRKANKRPDQIAKEKNGEGDLVPVKGGGKAAAKKKGANNGANGGGAKLPNLAGAKMAGDFRGNPAPKAPAKREPKKDAEGDKKEVAAKKKTEVKKRLRSRPGRALIINR